MTSLNGTLQRILITDLQKKLLFLKDQLKNKLPIYMYSQFYQSQYPNHKSAQVCYKIGIRNVLNNTRFCYKNSNQNPNLVCTRARDKDTASPCFI